ncbi:response regulator transcription factor [Peribacillus sp. ACCC06369]|uniref:response regulator transcription factor n=1 Tax=Peribacillus sp. ACCC06369 TaxID=3055860 RepID=UPI0025A05EAF|nr:response regulator transcription factor [Peribacillus sp. ACCC06369]MDM5359243.1 response regulator transcription factor [Peribacillus sp. ACCC06369]
MHVYTILVVDDEEDMRNLIEMYLLNSGYQCLQAANGKEAISMVETQEVDLILLDIMMPGMDGFSVCEKIRENWEIPVIFVSAKGEEWDKVKGLKLGGDDYIVKPFNPGELVARVEAVLRRTGKLSLNEENQNHVRFGNISLNLQSRTVLVEGKPINLTLKEFELLLFLMRHKSQALSREQLLENVWSGEYGGSLRTVDTHIKTLRMKLSAADYIQTVWGIGYKIEEKK